MRLLAVFGLVAALWTSPAVAQTPCSFVLGFADLAGRLGTGTAGTCLENQRTLTAKEQFILSDKITYALPVGAAVQRTTTGLFSWIPQPNLTTFADANGTWTLTGDGVAFTSWEQVTNETAPPSTPPRQRSEQELARDKCFNFYVELGIQGLSPVHTPSERSRLGAEAEAANYLCAVAAEQDGFRGFDCFEGAWRASRGMERTFPGSGRKAYDDSYRACLVRP
jgi:hypothetical protein